MVQACSSRRRAADADATDGFADWGTSPMARSKMQRSQAASAISQHRPAHALAGCEEGFVLGDGVAEQEGREVDAWAYQSSNEGVGLVEDRLQHDAASAAGTGRGSG